MKNYFNFFEKLWEHSRTLRRVGLVLVMCLITITQAWGYTAKFRCVPALAYGNNWAENKTLNVGLHSSNSDENHWHEQLMKWNGLMYESGGNLYKIYEAEVTSLNQDGARYVRYKLYNPGSSSATETPTYNSWQNSSWWSGNLYVTSWDNSYSYKTWDINAGTTIVWDAGQMNWGGDGHTPQLYIYKDGYNNNGDNLTKISGSQQYYKTYDSKWSGYGGLIFRGHSDFNNGQSTNINTDVSSSTNIVLFTHSSNGSGSGSYTDGKADWQKISPAYKGTSGQTIYFDNTLTNWSKVYFKYGTPYFNRSIEITSNVVSGTNGKLLYITLPQDIYYGQFMFADGYGYTNYYPIDDSHCSHYTALQASHISAAKTYIPTANAQKGATTVLDGYERQVSISSYSHGTVTVTYTDAGGTGRSKTSGNFNVQQACVITVTATADDGYELTGLTVGGAAFTSGSTYAVRANTTVAATFTKKYTVTYSSRGAHASHNTVPVPATQYLSGATVTIKDNIGLMWSATDGEVFAGWATTTSKADAETVDYLPNATFDISADVTLYPVWKKGYYLITPNTTTKDGINFIAPRDLGSNSSYGVNEVVYSTKVYDFSSGSAINGVAYDSNKHLIYDTQTDKTDVYIYAYNSGSANNFYCSVIKDGSTCTNETINVAANSGFEKRITIEHSQGTRVVVSVASTGIKICNIKTIERGDPLPAAGTSGYQLSFPGRPGAQTSSVDGITFSSSSNSLKFNAGTMKLTNGKVSEYIGFTTTSAIQLQVKISSNKHFYVCTDKSSSSTAVSTGFQSGGTSGTYSINLSSGNTYYITNSNGDLTIDKIAFADYVACPAPTGLAAGTITENGATFAITDPADKNNYEIVCKTTSGAPAADATPTATGTSKSIVVNTLSAGTTYYAWVRAVDNRFNKSSWVALTGSTFKTEEAVPTHTLTWNLDGGTATGGTAAGSVAEGATLTAPTVTKVGYNFASWSPTVPATMPSSDATYTAQWTKVYASGTYVFENTAALGTAPNKLTMKDAEAVSVAAGSRIDNMFFSAMSITYESGTYTEGDDDFKGWKVKSSGTIKFFVEEDSEVTIGLGTMSGSSTAKVTHTLYNGTERSAKPLTAKKDTVVEAKAGTMVTLTLSPASSKTVTLKKIAIEDPCTKPTEPIGLGVDSKTHNSANLSWDGKSAGANGYKIALVANDGGSGAFDWKDEATAMYTASGLSANKSYTFKVKYKGTAGQCDFSDEVTTTFTTNKTPLSLLLSYTSTSLTVGDGSSAEPTLTGNTGSGTVTYSVTNASPSGCVTVNSSGVVTPVHAGTATITASVAETDGYAAGSATADFTIGKGSISPTLSYSSTTISVGDVTGTPTVDGNTGSGTVSYEVTSATPAGCITVNTSTGVVTAVAVGTATVTATIAATSDYNGNTATADFTISACSPTTLISTTLSNCTMSNADAGGTPGGKVNVAFSSCESSDGGYKMGSNDSYMYMTLSSGNFAAGDVVSIVITKNPNIPEPGTKALHIYKYMSSKWTELGSVVANKTGDGPYTYTYTLTAANVATDFNCIGLYRESGNQNPYVKSMTVTRPCAVPTYDITYELHDGDAGATVSGKTTYTEEDEDYDLPTPEWTGHTFLGWYATYSDGVYSDPVSVLASGSTGDKTYHAKWADGVNVVWTITNVDGKLYKGGTGYSVKAVVDNTSWTGHDNLVLSASDGVTLGTPTKSTVDSKAQIVADFSISGSLADDAITFSLYAPANGSYAAIEDEEEVAIDACPSGGGSSTVISIFKGTSDGDNTNTKDAVKYKQDKKWTDATTGLASTAKGVKDALYVFASNSWNTANSTVGGTAYTQGIQNGGSTASDYHFKIEIPTGYTAEIYLVAGRAGGSLYLGLNKSAIAPQSGTHADKVWYASYSSSKVLQAWTIEDVPAGTYYLVGNASDVIFAELKITLTGGSSAIATSLSWSGDDASAATAGTVNKNDDDADFRIYASPTPANAGGTITYSSSNTSVATVSSDGTVHIVNDGQTFITASMSAYGCYSSAEPITYSLEVADNCSDTPGTIVAEDGSAIAGNAISRGACEALTLRLTGHSGSTIQWKKDGENVGTNSDTYIVPTGESGVYTATVTGACTLGATNSITVTTEGGTPNPTIYANDFYVKSGKWFSYRLMKINEGETVSVTGAPDGWEENTDFFITTDANRVVSIRGKKTITTTPAAKTLTLTISNACGGTVDKEITIREMAATAQPTVAWIATNNDGGSGQKDNVKADQSTNTGLYKELENYYTITPRNCYWTTDEAALVKEYSQYDLIILTDYPNSQTGPNGSTSRSKSYTNAIGLLIDHKPILTFEAYVAGCPNWGIASNPQNTESTQTDLTLLCNAGDIFDDTSGKFAAGADIAVTDATSGQALQGFPVASSPDFVFIGKITDSDDKEYVVCCERQHEIAARMMVFGLNSAIMSSMTADGKTMVHGFVEYLLKTDAASVPDCSVIFNGGGSDNSWFTDANWEAGELPDAYASVRIDVPCVVPEDADAAKAGRIKIHQGGAFTGSLTIEPKGRMIVEKTITRVENNEYTVHKSTQPGDLVIQSDATGNGVLVMGSYDGTNQATVAFYTKAKKVDGHNVNQFIGTPFNDENYVFNNYYGTKIYQFRPAHDGNKGNENEWLRLPNDGDMNPFYGYNILTNNTSERTLWMEGTLVASENQSLNTYYNGSSKTENLFANSWAAPIDIAQFEVSDFGGAEATIYIFNAGTPVDQEGHTTGTYNYWSDGTASATAAGQYIVLPVESAPWTSPAIKVIPPMQAFTVFATATNQKVTLDYSRLVKETAGSLDKADITAATRAPKRNQVATDEPTVIRLHAEGLNGYAANMFVLEREDLSQGYDNGWDGRHLMGEEAAPQLYAITEAGKMNINCVPDIEGTILGFRPGEDSQYTIVFGYDGEGTWYLNDLKEQKSTLIDPSSVYTFLSEVDDEEIRFIISATPFNAPEIATGVTNLDAEAPKVQKIIYNDKLYIIRGGKVFSADGQLVK